MVVCPGDKIRYAPFALGEAEDGGFLDGEVS